MRALRRASRREARGRLRYKRPVTPRRARLHLLLCALAALAACGPPSSPDADGGDVDAGADAGARDAGAGDAGAADAGANDAGANDAGASDAGPADAGDGRVTFALRDGGIASGWLAAQYDHHAWWWTPSDEVTWAVLEPSAFAPAPLDRSVTFVSSHDVLDAGPLPDWPQPAVAAFTRDAGLSLGRLPLDGVAYVITGHDAYHLQEDGYGDFAWDLVRTGADGGRFAGSGVNNADYLTWDAPVFLPTAGRVVEVVRDAPDNSPGGYDGGAVNNLVGVRVAGAWAVYLLHFRQGSIPSRDAGTCEPTVPGVACVEPGAWLPEGAYLGRVGNSGVSLEPHLHVTMLYLDVVTGRSWSIPSEFANTWSASTPVGPATRHDFLVPRRGEWLSSMPF